MKKGQIACQLYTLRDYCKTAEDLLDTCKKVRAIGYESVQVSGIGPIPYEQVREIMDECGLTVCITHTGYDAVMKNPMEVIRQHKLLNCANVGIGCMPGDMWGSYETQMEFARGFAGQAAIFEEHGIRLSYHNHSFEFTRFAQGVPMEAMTDLFLESGINLILDLFWVQAAGGSPVDWIHKVAGHMNVVHFKDMTVIDNHFAMAEVGEGNMNYPAIIKACDDTGVKWAAVEQDTCRTDPIDCVKTSFDNIMKML